MEGCGVCVGGAGGTPVQYSGPGTAAEEGEQSSPQYTQALGKGSPGA